MFKIIRGKLTCDYCGEAATALIQYRSYGCVCKSCAEEIDVIVGEDNSQFHNSML